MALNTFLKKDPVTIFYGCCFLAYIILSICFFDSYVNEWCIDLIAYLNIAGKYARGYFQEAVNGYWAPLISWAIVPLLWLKTDPFVAFRIVNLLAGLLLLGLSAKMIERLSLRAATRAACFFTLTGFTLFYQLTSYTPDFFSVLPFFAYVYIIADPLRHSRRFFWLKAGIAGALCYFSKSFFFAFVSGHLILFTLWESFKYSDRRKDIVTTMSKAFLTFLFLSGLWIACLSSKYGKFMISSSGSYNFSLIQPDGDLPQFYDSGLLPPPDSHSVSSWVDPSYYPVKPRNPFESMESFRYQLSIWSHNGSILLYVFRWWSYLGPFILLAGLYIPFAGRRQHREQVLICFFQALLYIGGYFLIFIQERYMLPPFFLLIPVAFFVADDLLSRFHLSRFALVPGMVLAAVFLKNIYHGYHFMQDQLPALHAYRKNVYRLEDEGWLKHKRFASEYEYEQGNLVAFLNDAYYYGTLNKEMTGEEIERSFRENRIDYFFYYQCGPGMKKGCSETLPSWLKGKEVVYKDEKLRLSVYRLR